MATACAEIEDLGRAGDLDMAPDLLVVLGAEFARVAEALAVVVVANDAR